MLFDDIAIYVGVRAFDSEPDRILAFLTRRDTDSASDWIRVLIDSSHDRRTAYEFTVNPAGVKRDKYHFNDNNDDESWDAVWDVAVRRDRDGWCAEFRIPYSQLRFGSSGDTTLGFAIAREVARLEETSTWPLLPRGASGYVSSFGELAGVARPPGGKRLELAPYVLGQIAHEAGAAGEPAAPDARPRRHRRPRPEVRRHAVAGVHRHGQPGLRPGGSRPRRSEPVGVRDLLQRAAPVLRRGVGRLSVRVRRLFDLLLAPHRAPAARRARRHAAAT